MKKIAVFIGLSFINWTSAQLTDIKYIPSISTDTINTQARLYTSLLSKNKFNPMVFEQGIKVGERRQEVKLRDKDIFYIEFTDKNGDKRVFKQIPELNLGGKLLEVMAVGKISWYRNYFSYKADAWDQNYAYDDYFVKGNEIVKVPVKGKYKKKLKNLLAEKPELAREVNRMITDLDIKEIIEKYNN
ncbi:MAG: hypothetical protein Q4A00_04490 [Flavobacteriaceae bacterium]|nr:hypothetical protein [Flavobacteriaceae bacterium]